MYHTLSLLGMGTNKISAPAPHSGDVCPPPPRELFEPPIHAHCFGAAFSPCMMARLSVVWAMIGPRFLAKTWLS
jgi:hypothetical protein